VIDRHLSIEEWEQLLGQQVRAARIERGLDQTELASLANVSIATLSNLERGRGSQVRTLVAVARALDRTEWLETFAPNIGISPMQMLRTKRRAQRPPMRVRRRAADSSRG